MAPRVSEKLQVNSGDILVQGPNNFAASGNKANVWVGDTHHSVTAIYASGLQIGTYKVPQALFIQDKTGNVGIGTSAPASTLDVVSTNTSTAGLFNNTGGGEIISGQLNGNEVFRLNGSGTVGMLNAVSSSPSRSGGSFYGANITSTGTGSDGVDAFGGESSESGQFGGAGVVGTGGENTAMSSAGGTGVVGYAGSGDDGGDGVDGFGVGVGSGVFGSGGSAFDGGTGVVAAGGDSNDPSGQPGDGILARPGSGGMSSAYAGDFIGDINVTGAIFAGTKDFKIDHPLDPANKYLLHASVESSEMLNMYSGNIGLDSKGEATVVLPNWFETLNTDFRYQLTSIGAPSPGLYIAQQITRNSFTIAGGAPGATVSWQITAVRHDAYAKAHPLVVEEVKDARERG